MKESVVWNTPLGARMLPAGPALCGTHGISLAWSHHFNIILTFASRSSHKFLYTFLDSSLRATYPACCGRLNLRFLILLCEEYNIRSLALCNFFNSPVISTLLGANLFVSTLFPYSLYLCSSLNNLESTEQQELRKTMEQRMNGGQRCSANRNLMLYLVFSAFTSKPISLHPSTISHILIPVPRSCQRIRPIPKRIIN